MASPVTSSTAVYFVTGANRGLGYGCVERLAARPDALVYASTREPSTAEALQQLATRCSNVRVVKLSVESDVEHQAAVALVQAEAGRVDVVLACAGISVGGAYERTEVLRIDQLRQHFEVNTFGPVRLFQHFFPLLSLSADPKFIVVSTGVASIAFQPSLPHFPVTCYALSKAAINFFTVRVHVEHPNITSFPLSPGTAHTRHCAVHRRPHPPSDTHSLPASSLVFLIARLGADGDGQYGRGHCGHAAGSADSGAERARHTATARRVGARDTQRPLLECREQRGDGVVSHETARQRSSRAQQLKVAQVGASRGLCMPMLFRLLLVGSAGL